MPAATLQPPATASSPIGVFDSGIGGLSVLQALRHELPHENYVYVADSVHAPYGERGDAFVQARTLAVARHLVAEHHIKALVIACNTATAAAIELLREALPHIPVIGVEPALKPAALSSQTHHVGVMGTRGTVTSARFERLRQEHSAHTQFAVQACDGLARAIEKSTELPLPVHPDATEIRALCAKYTATMGPFGQKPGEIDTLVLGCTHYVFAKDHLRALVGPDVHLVDTGAPVARHTRRLLKAAGLLATGGAQSHPTQQPPALVGSADAVGHVVAENKDGGAASADVDAATLPHAGDIRLFTTGQLTALQAAAQRWLQLPASVCHGISIESGGGVRADANAEAKAAPDADVAVQSPTALQPAANAATAEGSVPASTFPQAA
jgi:glutamate racemase